MFQRASNHPYDTGTLNNLPITTTKTMSYPHAPKYLSLHSTTTPNPERTNQNLCTKAMMPYAGNIFATLDSPTNLEEKHSIKGRVFPYCFLTTSALRAL
jgi:hypothetical protein